MRALAAFASADVERGEQQHHNAADSVRITARLSCNKPPFTPLPLSGMYWRLGHSTG